MRCSLTLNRFLILFLTAGTSSVQGAAPLAQAPKPDSQFLLTYPSLDNSQGEVLLENEHVVVQRFTIGAGEWEGLHTHPGNQVYVHVVGGEWSGRANGKPSYTGSISETGSVGWILHKSSRDYSISNASSSKRTVCIFSGRRYLRAASKTSSFFTARILCRYDADRS